MLLFSSDLDGTLLGEPEATWRFKEVWEAFSAKERALLCYNSGRLVQDILSLFSREPLARPDVIIGGLGTQIYDNRSGQWLDEFSRNLSQGWNLALIERVLVDWPDVVKQPKEYLHAFKSSWYWPHAQPAQRQALAKKLNDAGLKVQLVYSSNRDLDILPCNAGKGAALLWLAKKEQIRGEDVVVAGDTANDMSMFELEEVRGIVVANAQNELRNRVAGASIFFASKVCAGGVLEGLEHFGVFNRSFFKE